MPREANLIIEDSLITVTIGSVASIAAPVFTGGTAKNIMGTVRTAFIESETEQSDVHGGGELVKRFRFHSKSQTMEIEGFVPSSGYRFADTSGPLTGFNVRISTVELSTMTTPRVWDGVITRWRWETGSNGSGQVERITINLNPDYNMA